MPVKHIMISAGEASGDLHAANLVRSLHKIDPTIKVRGMGSDRMREAGVELLYDCRDIAVMGIVEVLAKWGTIMGALDILADSIAKKPPDLLILVDYQEFNMKLAKRAKKHGVKVMFYIGPQVWAWRSHRVKKIGRNVDMMAVLFPFEVDFYSQANVPVRFVGNPLVDEVKPTMSRDEAMSFFKLDPQKRVIGLLPGSRRSEIHRLIDTELESAKLIHQSEADTQFVIPLSKNISDEDAAAILAHYPDLPVTITRSHFHDMMQCCHSVIVASGTASLETALMNVPMVIIYKMSNLSYRIMRRLMTIDNVGLPNIVAGRVIVKELLQDDATAENISAEIIRQLTDESYHHAICNDLKIVKERLGTSGGSDNVAQLAYYMLNDQA